MNHRNATAIEVSHYLGIPDYVVEEYGSIGLFPKHTVGDNNMFDIKECAWAWFHFLAFRDDALNLRRRDTQFDLIEHVAISSVINLRTHMITNGDMFENCSLKPTIDNVRINTVNSIILSILVLAIISNCYTLYLIFS